MLNLADVPLHGFKVMHFLLSLPTGVRLRNYRNGITRRRELQNLNSQTFAPKNGNTGLCGYDFYVQLVLLLVILSIAAAQRGGQYSNLQTVPIIQYNNEINYDGTYRYK